MKHHCKYVSKRLALLLMVLFVGTLTLTGCGSDDYDTSDTGKTAPVEGQTENVIIGAATLKSWVDAGKVNADSYDKVVILDTSSEDVYNQGHIPGAQWWDIGTQVMTRTEGPIETVNMVLDGSSMDTLMEKHGIDTNTTIVITGDTDSYSFYPLRAYFLFRYWGFPKEQVKVLDGFNDAWTYDVSTTAPDMSDASYSSVKEMPQINQDLRASLSEMIVGLSEESITVVDFRAAAPTPLTRGVWADDHNDDGVATSPSDNTDGDYDAVVFDGTMKNGEYFSWGAVQNADGTFKDAETLKGEMQTAGIDNSKKLVTMCRTAYIASTGFFAFDAILGWDSMVYDGSWSQWGSLSTQDTGRGGLLPDDSQWYTDDSTLMDNIIYRDTEYTIEPARIKAPTAADPFSDEANNVENEDYDYWNAPLEEGPAGELSSGGGGC
jgi:3-mercaptopyruvate sulfurtransferase SseA